MDGGPKCSLVTVRDVAVAAIDDKGWLGKEPGTRTALSGGMSPA